MVGVLRGGVVAQLVVHVVGIGTYQRDAEALLQGKDAVVFKECRALACGLCGQFEMRFAANLRGGILLEEGMVKQSGLELEGKDAFDGAVHRRHAHAAALHGLLQEGEAVGAEVHVHACKKGHLARFLLGGSHMVAAGNPVDALQVAHHEAAEVPAVPQHAGEQIRVAGGGDAVDGVVAGHDAEGAVIDGRLESGQDVFFEVSPADMAGTSVVAALGDAVGDEMLQRGDDSLAGSAADHGRCHLRGEVHVLAVGLFHAGPAGLAAEVDDGTVADVPALCGEFTADDGAHLLQQFRIPGSAEADRRGKHRGADGHVPVGGFLGQEDGNAQARGIHGVVLKGVVSFYRQTGIQACFQGLAGPGIRAESGPEHSAVLLLDKTAVCVGDDDGGIGDFLIHRPSQGTEELSQFLFEGHAAHEVVNPVFRFAAGVFVNGSAAMARNQQESRCKDEKVVKLF